MVCRLLVRQLGGIFNLANRLNYVDSAGTFSDRDFCLSNGRVQIGGQVDTGRRRFPPIDVQRIGGFDQVSWLQPSPCAVVEPLRPEVVGGAINAFIHVCIFLISEERLTLELTRRR